MSGAIESKSPSPEVRKLLENPPRVLLYLGAGASHFAGYRTFADFPVLLFNEDVRKAEGLPPLPDNAARLLQEIKISLETKDGWTTHDRFLWRLNEYQQILDLNQGDPALQSFLREASRPLFDLSCCTTAAVNVMAQTTVRHYSSNRVHTSRTSNSANYSNMQRVHNLYMEMARLNNGTGCLPVFTTNYDMLIEDLCNEFGSRDGRIPLANGLPHVSQEGEIWGSNSCSGPRGNGSILQLFRLHGCACWFYHQTGDSNIYYHRGDASSQSIRNLCAMYPGLERERGAGPHGFGFRSFYRLLQVCDLLVFIGFSFRDDDVMHVLLKALAERREQLRLLIVDSTYTRHNVQANLESAARRSTFPAYVPKDSGITALRLDFGLEPRCNEIILDQCKKLLNRKQL